MTARSKERSPESILNDLRGLNEHVHALLEELGRSGRPSHDLVDVDRLPAVVRTARERKGLTQKALAEKVHLGVRTVQALERGARGISLANLRKILDALDIGLWLR
jgi:ribosome-binding protein aMBF1 (putative translation factor)